MKNLLRISVFALLTAWCMGQVVTSPTLVITQSGSSVNYPNASKGTVLTIQLGIASNTPPVTASVITSGCFTSGSCTIIDTYLSTSSTLRTPATLSQTYDYFQTSATWSGGSGVGVGVTYTISSPVNQNINAVPLQVVYFNGAPTDNCAPNYTAIDITTGIFYNCWNNNWNLATGSSGITQLVAGAGLSGGGSSSTTTLSIGFAGSPLAIEYYNAAGTGWAAANAPTTPASVTQTLCSTPNGSNVAQAPTYCLPGISGRSVTGTSDTILSTDCAPQRVQYNNASPIAVTLPTQGTLGNTSCTFKVANTGAGTVTITPNTNTINGAASLAVLANQSASIYVDPASATNWQADVYCETLGGSTRQLLNTGGVGSCPGVLDMPEQQKIMLASCNNATATMLVNTPGTLGFAAACRGGTNNLTGVITATPATGASFSFATEIPLDWDATQQPFIAVSWGSGANAAGTVIWTASSACTGATGALTDDPAFVAEAAMATKTMTAANRMWAVSSQFVNVTGGNNCAGGSTMFVKLTLSGTANTGVINVSQVVMNFNRRPVVQAN